ncbi:MAG TPA: imidazole glycerol phosphate synthase subunit HisH, partial [Streptosporangiaceae bacterium]
RPPDGSRLFAGIGADERFYFVHSYAVRSWPGDTSGGARPRLTWAEHGQPFVAAVEDGALCATQFHPEKSGDAGAVLLKNWLEMIA